MVQHPSSPWECKTTHEKPQNLGTGHWGAAQELPAGVGPPPAEKRPSQHVGPGSPADTRPAKCCWEAALPSAGPQPCRAFPPPDLPSRARLRTNKCHFCYLFESLKCCLGDIDSSCAQARISLPPSLARPPTALHGPSSSPRPREKWPSTRGACVPRRGRSVEAHQLTPCHDGWPAGTMNTLQVLALVVAPLPSVTCLLTSQTLHLLQPWFQHSPGPGP